MIEDINNKLLNDESIKNIYDKIEEFETKEKGWTYHNYAHVLNVTSLVEKLLLLLGYDEDFFLK